MSSLTTFVSCPNVQDRLENVFCTVRAEGKPLLNYIFSEANNFRVLNTMVNKRPGGKVTVDLVYNRRVLESEIDTTQDFACSATNKRGETSTSFDLDTQPAHILGKKIALTDLIERCESSDEYYARLILDMIDGLERKMETDLATDMVAFAGAFSTKDLDQDGTSITANTKIVSTRFSDKSLDYFAHAAIMQTARLNGYCGAPVIAGEYEIKNYYDAIQKGCCWDGGIDLSQVAPETPIILPSYRITDALSSASKFITFAPGSILPVWFNRYADGFWAVENGTDVAGVIVSPFTGIPFDYRAKRDCDDWSIEIGLAWDVFAAPDDMFENSDVLDGNRLIHKHQITNP